MQDCSIDSGGYYDPRTTRAISSFELPPLLQSKEHCTTAKAVRDDDESLGKGRWLRDLFLTFMRTLITSQAGSSLFGVVEKQDRPVNQDAGVTQWASGRQPGLCRVLI